MASLVFEKVEDEKEKDITKFTIHKTEKIQVGLW